MGSRSKLSVTRQRCGQKKSGLLWCRRTRQWHPKKSTEKLEAFSWIKAKDQRQILKDTEEKSSLRSKLEKKLEKKSLSKNRKPSRKLISGRLTARKLNGQTRQKSSKLCKTKSITGLFRKGPPRKRRRKKFWKCEKQRVSNCESQ